MLRKMWGKRKRLLVPGYTKAIRQFSVKKRAKRISRGGCSKGFSETGGGSRQGDMSCILKKGEQNIACHRCINVWLYQKQGDAGQRLLGGENRR